MPDGQLLKKAAFGALKQAFDGVAGVAAVMSFKKK
jgi:hypothetical protein